MTAPIYASLGWSCFGHMAPYMNTAMFHKPGGFQNDIQFAGDYDFFDRALSLEPFARIGQTLAYYRRHGKNQSMQMTSKHRAEIDAIESQFAPSQKWKKQYYRYLLKFWLNARNPS